MPSNHLILCCPLFLPSIFPSIRVFSRVSSLYQVAKVLALHVYKSRCLGEGIAIFLWLKRNSLSCVQIFATPWTAARQVFLSFTISQSLLKLMSFESVMPSNHLILCCPLLLLPSIFPSIRVFSNELAFHITWPKYWSFSISPFNASALSKKVRVDLLWD